MVIAGYAALASPVQAQQVTIDRLPRCAPLKKPDLPLTFDAAGASFRAHYRLTGHGRCFGSFYHESRQFFEDAEIARSKLPGGASSRPSLCDQQKESTAKSASGLAVSCRAECGTPYPSKYSNGRFSGRFLLVKLGFGQHVTNCRQIDHLLPITPLCGIFERV